MRACVASGACRCRTSRSGGSRLAATSASQRRPPAADAVARVLVQSPDGGAVWRHPACAGRPRRARCGGGTTCGALASRRRSRAGGRRGGEDGLWEDARVPYSPVGAPVRALAGRGASGACNWGLHGLGTGRGGAARTGSARSCSRLRGSWPARSSRSVGRRPEAQRGARIV